eukprot:CAMPEP_0119133226 /NCGR_PEP_ID=MMETSP1310-20130426/13263_1 /TAXON_ID=464262 /ORGANISM="Genus nov. species nov., Strain RCC2339" /LENGTH=224 /DNA_ID=CAMNT_0007123913 /DNA_START=150 /DNA_END=824 /DNA_ORIENTATION=-
MPKSKRNRKVTLSQVSKKPAMEKKQNLFNSVRDSMDKFENVFVFTTKNMRNSPLKELRTSWGGSRFYIGKNKVLQRAVGRTEAEEYSPGSHKLAEHLVGPDMGLLFTNQSAKEVMNYFKSFSKPDYPRSGFIATETVQLDAGPLPQFSHAIEPHLRSLGMPTALKEGVVTLIKDFTVCKEGKALTPEQARILKLLDIKMAEFFLILCCHLTRSGKFVEFIQPGA